MLVVHDAKRVGVKVAEKLSDYDVCELSNKFQIFLIVMTRVCYVTWRKCAPLALIRSGWHVANDVNLEQKGFRGLFAVPSAEKYINE